MWIVCCCGVIYAEIVLFLCSGEDERDIDVGKETCGGDFG